MFYSKFGFYKITIFVIGLFSFSFILAQKINFQEVFSNELSELAKIDLMKKVEKLDLKEKQNALSQLQKLKDNQKELKNFKQKMLSLHTACFEKNPLLLKRLLRQKHYSRLINSYYGKHSTLLSYCVIFGEGSEFFLEDKQDVLNLFKCLALLLQQKADINLKDENDSTPLYLVFIQLLSFWKEGYHDMQLIKRLAFLIIKFLLKNGADPNINFDKKFSPLKIVRKVGCEKIEALLKLYGAREKDEEEEFRKIKC